MADRDYLLGVDIGTYSSKGVLVTLDGAVTASHVVEHTMSMPRPGWFEHDADAVWWHDFVVIVRALLAKSRIAPERILGIGTSAIGSCVLPIDADGKPLRPAILYGIDTRATAEISELNDALGEDAILQRGGSPLTSQASGPKVRWIRTHEPEVYARTHTFLTSQDYLVYRLTGKATIDVYTAGGYAPMFDATTRQWIPERGALVTPVDRLPDILWSCEVAGGVTAEAAAMTGLAPGTPVIAGTTDAAAEAVSGGLAQVGDMLVMFGSSIFFVLKTETLRRSRVFWSTNFLEPGTYALLGGMSTAGSLTRWFREQFGHPEVEAEATGGENAYEALAALAAQSRPGAGGLVALPYFEGERTPLHDPGARGALFGLTLRHSRADVYRALLESVAYGIRHNIEVMAQEGARARRILAVGGGARNRLWLEIVSGVAGVVLDVPEQQIGASYGDAFMAGVGIGAFRDLGEIARWVRMRTQVAPSFPSPAAYEDNYAIYRELYTQTRALMHRLTLSETGS